MAAFSSTTTAVNVTLSKRRHFLRLFAARHLAANAA